MEYMRRSMGSEQGLDYTRSLGFQDQQALEKSRSAFMSKVYTWMTGGLLLTAGVSWWALESQFYLALSPYYLFIALGTLGLVFFLSARIEKMSVTAAMASFLLYAGVNGLLMSVILAYYPTDAITNAFVVSAGAFAALSLYGYTTKRDLSAVGKFMFIGLVGIILASIVNMFAGSMALDWTITILGVLIFAGLTAYDTQRLRNMHDVMEKGKDIATKAAIIGALALYLDFINLFLFILRIFGNRD
jgi:FtsH-binding integral membrane protein